MTRPLTAIVVEDPRPMTSTPLTRPRRAVREGQEIVVASPDVAVTQRMGVKLVRACPGG